jgi:hypothetical protein
MGPSTDWGWHGSFPKGLRIAGIASVAMMVGLLLTTRDFQQGAMAVPWIAGIATVVVVGLLLSARRRR